ALSDLPGTNQVNIDYVEAKPEELNRVTHTIAVMSGKGGVGKSLVSGLIAIALKRKGFEVGILDGDITGPSIPRMFGIKLPPGGTEGAMFPQISGSGIGVMSVNLLLGSEDEAAICRGPVVTSTIKEFKEEVVWGNLDYLIIDLPPGTSDAPLTVMQNFPLDGVIIVLTPQGLVHMIVKKAVNMARKMNQRILGLVENMSYFYLAELDRRIEISSRSLARDIASEIDAPLFASLPVDPEIARLCDEGKIEDYGLGLVEQLGEALLQSLDAVPAGAGTNI
ncbi:MAG: Mrp/NBP35 family ATP-binding protein, partial [Dehalococcoidales bacterium]|nr:Mrp/NBP35 family ATP-binding protein [Dehalococcoidales bacterium]